MSVSINALTGNKSVQRFTPNFGERSHRGKDVPYLFISVERVLIFNFETVIICICNTRDPIEAKKC